MIQNYIDQIVNDLGFMIGIPALFIIGMIIIIWIKDKIKIKRNLS